MEMEIDARMEHRAVPRDKHTRHLSKHWPYLWCHVCDKMQRDAIRVWPRSPRLQGFGICLACLGKLNLVAMVPADEGLDRGEVDA